MDESVTIESQGMCKRLSSLTSREADVLALIGQGRTNAETSEYFGTAHPTTKTHVSAGLRKLGLRDRVQATIVARDNHLEPVRQTTYPINF